MVLMSQYQMLTLFYTMGLSYIVYVMFIYYENNIFINDTESDTDFDSGNEGGSDSDSESEQVKEQVKETIRYEDKYLAKYRAFNDKFAYSQDDYETEYQKYEELIYTNRHNHGELNLEEIQKESCDYMHNQFLIKFKNSYVMENTPLGNVAMCYNHEKGSFEYYSDKIIPYRYLEPVARKYVIFFHCKQLYIDMEEQLKQAELKLEQEKVAKEDKLEKELESKKKDPPKKEIFAKLKNYNKENSISSNFKNTNPLSNYIKPNINMQNK